MKCMCAQTKPRFILSSEGVLGGMEFEPKLTPKEKSPLPENFPRGGSNPRHHGQRAHALPTELFRPHQLSYLWIFFNILSSAACHFHPLRLTSVIQPSRSSSASSVGLTIPRDAALQVRPSLEPSGRGDFPLGVNMGSDSIPRKLFWMRV